MKKIATLVIVFGSTICFAQQTRSLQESAEVKQVHLNQKSKQPDFIEFSDKSSVSTQTIENWLKSNLNLPENFTIAKTKSLTDKMGQQHDKFQTYFDNYPIEFGVLNVHSSAGKVISVNGNMVSSVTLANRVLINPESALLEAKNVVNAKSYKWDQKLEEANLRTALNNPDFSYDPKTSLVLLRDSKSENSGMRYAYKMDIYAHEPESREDIYIDAENGSLLLRVNKIMDGNVTGTAITKYHGTKTIITDSISPNKYELHEMDRLGEGVEIETLNSRTNFESGSIPFTDSNNVWNNVNAAKDEAATDGHWGLEKSFDYFFLAHNRLGYDNIGSKLLLYVHYDKNWFNAQWVGNYMRFGDGNGQPLTSIDVVGHELTHGVTQETAGLLYQGESGGLNESFSDIFGSAIEYAYDTLTESWEIGKGNFVLRDMANPNRFAQPDTYEGSSWSSVKNCSPTGNNDFCGVHTNSGVQNFWYYLLVNGGTGTNDNKDTYSVQAIGFEDAGSITYRNLSVYLTPTSDFADAAFFGIKSAIDLFGEGSQQHISTVNAWSAVGLGKPYTFLPVSDFSVQSLQCTVPSTVQFINSSGSAISYKWDFGDGTATSTLKNPSHIYSSPGSYTVKLISTNINGSDTLIKAAIVNIFTQSTKPSLCAVSSISPFAKIGIYRVQFNSIDFASLAAVDEGGYLDNECVRTYVQPGLIYPITITTSPLNSVFTRTLIDFNDNGDFDLPNELVFSTNQTIQTHNGNIQIPSTAVLDKPLRMRIISSRSNANQPDLPCNVLKGGQIEDYAIVVTNVVGINQNDKPQFSIAPNPASSSFVLTIESNKGYYSIFDVSGRLLKKAQINALITTVDVNDFAKGLYFIQIESGSKYATSKFLVD